MKFGVFGLYDQKIREEKLGFIMKFAENLVLKLMEDPKERDRRFRELVYRVKDRCE